MVGTAIAEDLITNFAGTRVYVPTGGAAVHNSRSNPIPLRRFVELRRAGLSVADIAAEVGCSERAVFAGLAQWRSMIRTHAPTDTIAAASGYSFRRIQRLKQIQRLIDRSGYPDHVATPRKDLA